MANYDFHQLSYLDFEHLARDLIQAEEGVTLESFKTGKDGGIDFRYARGDAHTIVQCKRYVGSDINALIAAVTKEAVKVKALNPKRYIFVTALPLSNHNKKQIQAEIGAQYLALDDIWGCDHINNLLTKHETIERNHYKLWLASRAVLDRVLHNEVATQSDFAVKKVYRDITRYVQTKAYPQALEMLETRNVVVISGQPGVGKTTLANMLLYRYLEQGYEAVVIKRDVSEGQKLLQGGKKQIFHFDDFMGATFLGERGSPLERNGDRAILEFIEMIEDSPTARLVLTTRQHILSQAFNASERMRHSALKQRRVVVTIGQYHLRQRAEILYNHIFFSELPAAYRSVLLDDDFYLEVLKHPKFNPRLIDWLSNYQRVKRHPPETYRAFIRRLLADPSEIWRHAYHVELSDAGRSLLLALFTHEGKAGTGNLGRAFQMLHRVRAARNHFTVRPEDYSNAVAELANAFIKPTGVNAVEVIDPSVLDLLNSVIQSAPQNAVDLAAGAQDVGQIERLWTFATRAGRGTVLPALRDGMADIAPNLQTLVLADRRHRHGDGVFYFDLSFEKRLVLLLAIAQETRSSLLAPIIDALVARMQKEWVEDRVDLNDAAELLRSLASSTIIETTERDRLWTLVRAAALAEVAQSARSDQIRELIYALDVDDGDDPEAKAVLIAACEAYRRDHFADELRQTNTMQGYEDLLEDLTLFQTALGVNVEGPIDAVQTGRDEFEEHESSYADHHEDEWKERWRDERASERDVRDMFGSLKSD